MRARDRQSRRNLPSFDSFNVPNSLVLLHTVGSHTGATKLAPLSTLPVGGMLKI